MVSLIECLVMKIDIDRNCEGECGFHGGMYLFEVYASKPLKFMLVWRSLMTRLGLVIIRC